MFWFRSDQVLLFKDSSGVAAKGLPAGTLTDQFRFLLLLVAFLNFEGALHFGACSMPGLIYDRTIPPTASNAEKHRRLKAEAEVIQRKIVQTKIDLAYGCAVGADTRVWSLTNAVVAI
jgi:hypothetical protein